MVEKEKAGNPLPAQPAFVSAYAIFEGGGARGLAHVGVLRAMEKSGLAPLGVAGTSAGAIFAALVAVGYKPDEIFADGDDHILKSLEAGNPTDLIGQKPWRQLKRASTSLALLLAAIFASTFLSTVLAAMVLGDALQLERDVDASFVGGIALSLLAARLFHGLIWKARTVHIALATTGAVLLTALANYSGLVSIKLMALSAGFAVGVAISGFFIKAPIALLLGGAMASLLSFALLFSKRVPLWLIPVTLFGTMALGLIIAMRWAKPLLTQQGLVDTSVVQKVINQALLEKLRATWDSQNGELPNEVLFRHIEPNEANGFIPLKVVTTNIDLGRLVILDSQTPDVPVAQAVAASAALPLVFSPAALKGMGSNQHRYADGGLVSNLPSWVFRDDKRRKERFEAFEARQFRRIPIYAVTLLDPVPVTDPSIIGRRSKQLMRLRTSIRYFLRLAGAAVFGGQGVVQNFIPDLKIIPVVTTLKTMSLDCTGAQAKHQVDDAERQALQILQHERKKDLLTTAILDEIINEIKPAMCAILNQKTIEFRVALLDPVSRDDGRTDVGLRVQYMVGGNSETNTDDELELDRNGNLAASAFTTGKIVYERVKGIGAGPLRMTKYEHALLPQCLDTAIAIPVSDESGRVERVLTVDSPDDLLPLKGDKAFNDLLVSLCVPLTRDLFNQAVEQMSYDT